MASSEEYLAYAEECLEWAKAAKDDEDRGVYLKMARDWRRAAMLLERDAVTIKGISESQHQIALSREALADADKTPDRKH